ncbi:MAG TPA: NAD(P)-dependent oxidoreductase, partial [Trueperaceae bacterium]|nr:NAD(P)-dependent oxidoreductase [Trueperaceae bacterium]
VGRGSTVDEPALLEALENRWILAAGLDVFQNEPTIDARFLALDNVVLLPHVGSASQPTHDAMGRLLVRNLVSWFAGDGPLTPVIETPWPAVAAEQP